MKDAIAGAALFAVRATPATVWLVLTIADEGGLSGWGEATLSGQEAAVGDAAARVLPALPGLPADDPAAAGRGLPFATLPEAALSSAIRQALHDLAARRAGLRLADHLGGMVRNRIGLYANFNRRTRDRSPAGMAASARQALEAGFTALKIAPFDEVRPDLPRGAMRAAMEPGLARLAAIRAECGPGVRLMADCHWRFDSAGAAEMIDALATLGLHWVECPIAETLPDIPDVVALRRRANAAGMRLAGLETAVLAAGFRPWLAAGAYDVMMPDVKYAGGPAEMLAIAAEFARHGVAFSPHNPSGPICYGHSLHLCAALPDSDLLEVQFDESPVFDALVGNALPAMTGGTSALPDAGSGLGLTPTLNGLDSRLLARAGSLP